MIILFEYTLKWFDRICCPRTDTCRNFRTFQTNVKFGFSCVIVANCDTLLLGLPVRGPSLGLPFRLYIYIYGRLSRNVYCASPGMFYLCHNRAITKARRKTVGPGRSMNLSSFLCDLSSSQPISLSLSYWRTTSFLIIPKWLLLVLKRTSETKRDNIWGKQALFLTFAQNRSIIILKTLCILCCIQITIIVKTIQSMN